MNRKKAYLCYNINTKYIQLLIGNPMNSPDFEFEVVFLPNVTKWFPSFMVNHINDLSDSVLVVGAEIEFMQRVCPRTTILLEETTTWQVLSAKIHEIQSRFVVLDLCFPYLHDVIHKNILALQKKLHFKIVYVTQVTHLRDYVKIFPFATKLWVMTGMKLRYPEQQLVEILHNSFCVHFYDENNLISRYPNPNSYFD